MKLGAMGDVPPKGTDGPLETTHTDERPPQVKARRPTFNLGRRRRTERDSESDAPYTPEAGTSSLMPW